jgi:S1-C subfamily serine protease
MMARSLSRTGHTTLLVTLTLVAAAGATPLAAQHRVEVKARSSRADADSLGRQERRLHDRVATLARSLDDEDLSASERRAVGEELNRAVQQLAGLASRMAGIGEQMQVRIERMTGDRARMMSRALTQTSVAQGAMPRGWIGLVAVGPALEPRVENDELLVRYLAYPRVQSVDPSSPAQRAGIMPGDTLLAYDGRDVREGDISLPRLLQPGKRLMVRFRRDGRVHDVALAVATAPTRIRQRRDEEIDETRAPWTVAGVPDAASFPRVPEPPSAVPAAPMRRVVVRSAPVAPMPPAPATALFGFSPNGVAGAQLATVTEGLARTLGVKRGVLVTNAPVGSPAFESGLQDGDVIVKVAGQDISSVAELRDLVRMVAENGDHAVALECVRDRRGRRVVLRW